MDWLIAAILGLIAGMATRRLAPICLGMNRADVPMPYYLPEVFGILVFSMVGMRFGLNLPSLTWYVATFLFLLVSVADGATKYIPTLPCFIGTGLALALHAWQPDYLLALLEQGNLLPLVGLSSEQAHLGGLALALAGAVLGFCMIELIRRVFLQLLGVEAMGSGDAILMLMIGAFLGPRAVVYALLPACIIGIFIGVVQKAVFKLPHSPFGPALAAGALLMAFFGDQLVAGFLNFHNVLYELPPLVLIGITLSMLVLLLVMLVRLKQKRAEYERLIEEDYAETDKKIKGH